MPSCDETQAITPADPPRDYRGFAVLSNVEFRGSPKRHRITAVDAGIENFDSSAPHDDRNTGGL